MMDLFDAVVTELREAHGCHTVILYGSHARGDATPESDIDVLGLTDAGQAYRDARPWRGTYLDAFIEPMPEVDEAQLKLLGGRVLVERDGAGTRLLEAVTKFYEAGPPKREAHEIAVIRTWEQKTLQRIARADLEGNYRRAMLLLQALEDYFALRGQWYLGSKAAFAWLAGHDPATHRAFEAALAPGASGEAIAELVQRVLETGD